MVMVRMKVMVVMVAMSREVPFRHSRYTGTQEPGEESHRAVEDHGSFGLASHHQCDLRSP
jgi:hypothetical protein